MNELRRRDPHGRLVDDLEDRLQTRYLESSTQHSACEPIALVVKTSFEPLSVFCFSSQSHRILLQRCTQDFVVALTLTMTHHFNPTRAIVPCARAQTGIGASLLVVLVSTARQCASVSFPFRWNLRLQRVILSDILILQVVSSFETHLFTLAVCDSDVTCCGLEDCGGQWWYTCIVERTRSWYFVYGTGEENPQMW